MAKVAPEETVALAHALTKMEYWIEFDPEALLAAIREKYGNSKQEISAAELKEVFLGLGYDKVKTEEDEEIVDVEGEGGGEEEGEGGEEGEGKPPVAAKAPPKQEVSKFAEATFDLLNEGKAGTLPLKHVLNTLNLCKTGYGEPSLRFAIKVIDPESTGALTERDTWWIVTQSTNTPLDRIARNHLRRAWRTSEKLGKPEDEGEEAAEESGPAGTAEVESKSGGEGEEGEEGEGEGKATEEEKHESTHAKPKPGPAEVKVLVEDFVTKITEDERLSTLLLKELSIPEPPKSAEENLPPADDE